MTARNMLLQAVSALFIALAASSVWAQGGRQPVLKDQFLGVEPFGALAMVHDRVASVAQATRIQVLSRGTAAPFKRRTTCVGLISHYEPSVTASSFFGVQIVRVFRSGTMGPAVFVKRNGGWVSRLDGKSRLNGMPAPRQVLVTSVDEFGQKHQTLKSLDGLTFGDGQPIANQWHAVLTADGLGNPALDTADDLNRPFWNAPPWSDKGFEDALKSYLESGSVLRSDNHLISFQVTDSRNVHTAVQFDFPCSDSNLMAVALRIFVPLKSEAFWYILQLEN